MAIQSVPGVERLPLGRHWEVGDTILTDIKLTFTLDESECYPFCSIVAFVATDNKVIQLNQMIVIYCNVFLGAVQLTYYAEIVNCDERIYYKEVFINNLLVRVILGMSKRGRAKTSQQKDYFLFVIDTPCCRGLLS